MPTNVGSLSRFVMLKVSRSFLSFIRHELFRRPLLQYNMVTY
ncbi:glucuronate isomerase [Metabacillus sediminilitoris]|nr:glucuronate isomerase [Metabacillus sediminilitoris]